MFEDNVPIVVVAYNRSKSLKRLLDSIGKAHYPSTNITLIISIDASENNSDVLKIAKDFIWAFGEKIVNYQSNNLGLRNHIIECGNYSIKYGSVIILEDDLYVGVNFYNYSVSALKFSLDKKYIGGISLYNHQLNVHTGDHFSALEDGFDNWYFQFASSWGQAWSKKQWESFLLWYENQNKLKSNEKIPVNVTNWSDKSWLKFYISYLVEYDKYFLYPRISLSTNFSDAGTHIGSDSTKYQVPLEFSEKAIWNFSDISKSSSIYDSFFESKILSTILGVKSDEICVDLYNYKPKTNHRYILTGAIMDYKVLKSFSKSLKPIETNIIENIAGEDLFFYDTNYSIKNKTKKNKFREIIYNIKGISYKNSFYLLRELTRKKFLKK